MQETLPDPTDAAPGAHAGEEANQDHRTNLMCDSESKPTLLTPH